MSQIEYMDMVFIYVVTLATVTILTKYNSGLQEILQHRGKFNLHHRRAVRLKRDPTLQEPHPKFCHQAFFIKLHSFPKVENGSIHEVTHPCGHTNCLQWDLVVVGKADFSVFRLEI